MTGAVSICHYGFENACISKLPHMERNSRCSSFVRMRNPTPLFSLGLWRRKATMATLEQKAFCVLQFAKNESFVSVQRAFRRQFNSDPPSPSSIRRWYQQFQTTGCFCKGKSAGRPRVSEESVERVSQSFCKPLNAQLNLVCHLLPLLETHHILHVSRIRVNPVWILPLG